MRNNRLLIITYKVLLFQNYGYLSVYQKYTNWHDKQCIGLILIFVIIYYYEISKTYT